MGGRQRNRQDGRDPLLSQLGGYRCAECRRPLELEMVRRADIERRDGTATGFILFQHYCACQPGTLFLTRTLGSYPSFIALFGVQPPLPYEAPFEWTPVADGDAALSRWSWELHQVADVDEFLLFVDDAATRRHPS